MRAVPGATEGLHVTHAGAWARYGLSCSAQHAKQHWQPVREAGDPQLDAHIA